MALVFPYKISYQRRSRNDVHKSFEDNFRPLKIYLWIHLVGYREDFRKNKLHAVTAVVFILVSTGNNLYFCYAYYSMLQSAGLILGRSAYSHVLIIVLNALLRIWTFLRSRNLSIFIRRVAKIYSSLAQEDSLDFKRKLHAILLTNDVFSICYTFAMFYFIKSKLKMKTFESFGEHLKFGLISFPHATWIFHASYFILQWTTVCPVVSAYFCVICYSIKETLVILHDKASRSVDCDIHSLFSVYRDITKLIKAFSEIYQVVLFMELAVVLSVTFRELFNIVFTATLSNRVRPFYLSFAFLRLVSVCVFASSVTNATTKVKDVLSFKALEQHKWNILQSLLIVKNESLSFTLFKSIVVDSGFIFTAIGHIVTYGILLATFNVSEKSSSGK